MTWAEQLQAIQAEAGGVLEVSLVSRGEWPRLVAASMQGDHTATLILSAVADTICQVASAPRRKPMLCLTCPRSLRRAKFTCGVILPSRPDPTGGLGLAICDHCAASATDAMPMVLEALKRRWPDMRTVQLDQHAAGHA